MQDSELVEILNNQNTLLNETIASLNSTIIDLRKQIEISTETNLQNLEVITSLNSKIEELTRKLQEAEDKLNKDSHNSSKPPSSDGLSKKNKKKDLSLRTRSGKKPGGQKGHTGKTLPTPQKIDKLVTLYPLKCQNCPHLNQCKNKGICGTEQRYTMDIIIETRVVQYNAVEMKCMLENGKRIKGSFPKGVNSRLQYGENLSANIVTLSNCGLSCDSIHKVIGSTFGIPLSTGTIMNKLKACAKKIAPVIDDIKTRLTTSKIVHFDETGVRIDGKTRWTHSSSNKDFTYLTFNDKRGAIGINDNGVLPLMNGGYAVHDCWKSYFKFKNVKHSICLQHIQRELKGIFENHPEQTWSKSFFDFLIEMKNEKERLIALGIKNMDKSLLESYSTRFDRLLELGRRQNPPPKEIVKKRGRKRKGKSLSLIDRLNNYKDAALLFIYNFDVPFTNNMAERSIRFLKIKAKVAGCFRSEEGADYYLNIRSYLDTARKQGKNIYQSIRQAFLDNPQYIFSPCL